MRKEQKLSFTTNLHKFTQIKCSIFFFIFFIPSIIYSEGNIFIREDFDSLDNWTQFHFPDVKNHSLYYIFQKDGESYLKTESNTSASGIIYKNEFKVYQFPKLRWKWKTENVYNKGDAKSKSGDDYSLRLFIIFNDKSKTPLTAKNIAQLFMKSHHEYTCLNYIWANKEHEERIITSPYIKNTKMILLQKGTQNVRQWHEEKINIIQDYRMAFGANPPEFVILAIMNDSDDTGESSISYLDYIEVYK